MNRLAKEASPYLLQHAHNPVDWWPWCDEALLAARERDVPILLSIGYSACHWCHVMEHESFSDASIAALMNEQFVCIKVDREERPDLDQIYQLVVQVMGRNGGWPLTVFLTPLREPFFGGTYFPPADRYGMPGFASVLNAIAGTWKDKREEVVAQSKELTEAIAEIARGDGEDGEGVTPGPELIENAAAKLMKRFDHANAGFGSRPKFPNTMALEVILRAGGAPRESGHAMLEAMRRGGIWDHLGGGFHRYSTDERWLVPHFEKMLYDNALLLRSYVDGERLFGWGGDTARALASYVVREMTDPAGGFYASQDADSDGGEGRFFVWDGGEIRAAAGADAAIAIEHFGVIEGGNFSDHGQPTGKTVLSQARVTSDPAALARAAQAMFTAREKRPKPFRDEKILTSWSSLMISALADAGMALDAQALIEAAVHAFDFLERKLVTTEVLRLAKGDVVKGPGFLDDYAFFANAAIDVYEATGESARLALARTVADWMLERFYEEKEGFFFTSKDGETLITRAKDPYDNAIPSGTSMACRALLRLGTLIDAKYTRIAETQLLRMAPAAIENPFGYGQLLCELDRLVRGSVDIVIVGPRSDPRTQGLAREAFRHYIPNRCVAWRDPDEPTIMLTEDKTPKEAPVAYVCRGRTCSLPVSTTEDLGALLA